MKLSEWIAKLEKRLSQFFVLNEYKISAAFAINQMSEVYTLGNDWNQISLRQ